MNLPRPVVLFAKLCFVLFILMTSMYCLLAYIPFTYQQIIGADVVPSVTMFAKFHPYFYWVALAMIGMTMVGGLHRQKTKLLTIGFLAFHAILGAFLLVHPLLKGLQNDSSSFRWSLATLVPLLWVAVIDWLGNGDRVVWVKSETDENRHIFRAAWQSALFLSILYGAVFFVRYVTFVGIDAGWRGLLLGLSWSVVSNLLVFMAIFVSLNLMKAIGSEFDTPPKAEFVVCNLWVGVLVWLILQVLIFPSITFGGTPAQTFAIAVASCVVASLVGLGVRLYRPTDGAVESGLALAVSPLMLGHKLSRLGLSIYLLLLSVLAYALAVRSAVMDWNFLLQKLTVILVWIVAFTIFYNMAPSKAKPPGHAALLLMLALTPLSAYKVLMASQALWQPAVRNRGLDIGQTLERHAGYDPSFKLTYDLLLPPRLSEAFYKFLNQNTNIPRSIPTHPVDVNLVEKLAGTDVEKPHIFIFVIDSLRRDYLSAYNPAVTFTPSIGAFARESVVMENAFTHYGGTGLSEPSIWVGGMVLHQQYVTPFYPMNALQKLIEVDNYQSFISNDSILKTIVAPTPSITELDKDIPNRDLDFCRSLEDLKAKVSRRNDPTRPIFAYTQPQNIHISVINAEGRSVPPGESYPGFDAPYASRLRRIDGCFGEFIKFLKTGGLYDKSIIILTSDHGDSLGENGRWGHAYTIFPEIIQVPLIVHLPPTLRASTSFNPRTEAFLTDITPTLYYLLGHGLTLRNEIFGRPLFTANAQEQAQYLRASYMIVSSYGPVYGILQNHGRTLYIVDGVNYEDYSFISEQNPLDTNEAVNAPMREEYQKMIRDKILAINRFYEFTHP